MKITLLVVGKTTDPRLIALTDEYCARLKHYVPFSVTEIPELKKVSALTQQQIKEKEGELILRQVGQGDTLILLDEHGREFRSLEFAAFMEKQLAAGGRNLIFTIGGAYGFSDAVYARAQGKISLSKMTFSHQMVRTIFAEQLYRAFTILKGEPYHHE